MRCICPSLALYFVQRSTVLLYCFCYDYTPVCTTTTATTSMGLRKTMDGGGCHEMKKEITKVDDKNGV